MKIYEIGTGYTHIPAQMGAATEIVVEELTRSFIKNGENAEIIDISAQNRVKTDLPITEVDVPKKFTGTDVSLGIMHKLKRVVYSIALTKKIKKLLKEETDKVVLHFHNQYNLYFALKLVPKKLMKKVIVAYTVHSYIWGAQWNQIEDTIKKRYFLETECVKKADVVFVLNNVTTEHLTSRLGVDRNKIVKIINGVNTKTYAPYEDEKIREIKQRLNLTGKSVIFQVGSVCDRKNQFSTVTMLKDYLKKHPNVVFMYAGGIIDDDYQQKIMDFVQLNNLENQVIYSGELSPGKELSEYYNISDCLVFTSNLESFGLVVIEAIATDKIVVVKDNLMFDLDTGYEVYRTPEEFVDIVDGILNRSINNSGREEVVSKYDWDVVARMHYRGFLQAGGTV